MTTSVIQYVAGFAFDTKGRVALIEKKRPTWQRGKRNGIGGHIEEGETPLQAMVREFREETGRETTEESWRHFVTLRGVSFTVHFFATFAMKLEGLKTTTDEEIVVVPVLSVDVFNAIPNLTWLIPMAHSMQFDQADSFVVNEVYGAA